MSVPLTKFLELLTYLLFSECFWANSIASTSSQAPNECTMPCAGDSTELCGAGNRINIYQNSEPPPEEVSEWESFESRGCYSDSVDDRALPKFLHYTEDMTVERCLQIATGHKYAAVEWSG